MHAQEDFDALRDMWGLPLTAQTAASLTGDLTALLSALIAALDAAAAVVGLPAFGCLQSVLLKHQLARYKLPCLLKLLVLSAA